MSDEITIEELSDTALYYEAFCGLVEPFPRLQALRDNPVSDLETLTELLELQRKENEWFNRKARAKEEYYKRRRERVNETVKLPYKPTGVCAPSPTYENEIASQHEPVPAIAKRFNEGKIDYTLIPVDAQKAEARVWMAGEEKYGRENWEKLWGDKTTEVVMQSLMRHANAILEGELIDEETGEHHAASIRCNCAMLIRHYNQTKGE